MLQIDSILKILSCAIPKQEDYQEKEPKLPLGFPDKNVKLNKAI
jgi:hypothetical protein